VSKVWKYIKEHDLQDPKDKRRILCDDKLEAVFKKVCTSAFDLGYLDNLDFLDYMHPVSVASQHTSELETCWHVRDEQVLDKAHLSHGLRWSLP
jgi:chromatin remodeling complex protein RSC6